MPEKLSLLLPVWAGDRPDYLAAAFTSSVQEQTRPPDQVVIVRDGPVPPALAGDLLGDALAVGAAGPAEDPWARCVAAFLEAKERKTGSTQTRAHYERTLRAFAAACPTHPARVTPAEVQAFAQAPARRRGRGGTVVESAATPATMARRTAVLSSFYRFAAKQVVGYDAAGRPVPLCTYHPAAAVEEEYLWQA